MGFILEGSGDPSIVYESPLTSLPAEGTVVGSAPTFSSSGVIFAVDSGIALDLTGQNFPSSLESEGSYTFFIERKAMGENDASIGSQGSPYGKNVYPITHNATGTTATPLGRWRLDASGSISPQINNTDTQFTRDLTTAGQSGLNDPIMGAVSWKDGEYSAFVDGRRTHADIGGTPFAGMLDYIWVGMDRGNANTTPDGVNHSRLAISLLPIEFEDAGEFLEIGDSFFDIGGSETSAPSGAIIPYLLDATFGNELQALERKANGREYAIVNGGVGGETTKEILARVPALLAAHNRGPIGIHAGTNDANTGSGVPADQLEDYQAIIQLCVDSPNVTDIYCENIITVKGKVSCDNAQGRTDVATVNANILQAIANVGSSQVIHIDAFSAFGGESPQTSPATTALIRGLQDPTVNGGAGDLHPSAQGEVLRALLYHNAANRIAPTVDAAADQGNLSGDIVAGVDLLAGVSDAESVSIEWSPAIPSGLTETDGVVAGTVTTPTGTAIAAVTATNASGTTIGKTQWTTLTIGAASNINETIND